MLRFFVMFVRELYQMTTKDRTLHVQNKDRESVCSERALKRRVVSKEQNEQAEIAAAKERLKAFTKPAKNYHDPERLARWREGRQNESRMISWAELGRRLQIL
jgi:hypothetical protein